MSYKGAIKRLKLLGRLESTGNHVPFHLLSKHETQVLQIAITDELKKYGQLDSSRALLVDVDSYAAYFNVTREVAVLEIESGLEQLFENKFSFVCLKGNFNKSRYISSYGKVKEGPIFSVEITATLIDRLMEDLSLLKQRIKGHSGLLVNVSNSRDAGMLASKFSDQLNEVMAAKLYWFFIEHLALGDSKFEICFENLIEQLGIDGDYATAQDLMDQLLNRLIIDINDMTDIRVRCSITPKVKANRFLFKIKDFGLTY